jgi:trans-aconitate methyltransferase
LERYPDAELLLVDGSELAVERCRRRFSQLETVAVRRARLDALELEGERFDLVASGLALHRLEPAETRRLLARIVGWLRPGGCLSWSDVVLGQTEAIQARYVAEARQMALAQGTAPAEWEALMANADVEEGAARLDQQMGWLTDAGFAAVDCTWKQGMWANLLAVKGG